jgi:ribosomal protein L24
LSVVCPKFEKPTRVKVERAEDGNKSRICKKCGGKID